MGLPEAELLHDRRPTADWVSLDTMGPEAMAFHAVVHTSSSFFAFGLKTAWDLRVLSEANPGLDWNRVATWAGRLAAPRAFWVPIRMLARELDLGMPPAFVRHAPADPGAGRLEKVVRERIFRGYGFVRRLARHQQGRDDVADAAQPGRPCPLCRREALAAREPADNVGRRAAAGARHADLVRQAWRNYRWYAKNARG